MDEPTRGEAHSSQDERFAARLVFHSEIQAGTDETDGVDAGVFTQGIAAPVLSFERKTRIVLMSTRIVRALKAAVDFHRGYIVIARLGDKSIVRAPVAAEDAQPSTANRVPFQTDRFRTAHKSAKVERDRRSRHLITANVAGVGVEPNVGEANTTR